MNILVCIKRVPDVGAKINLTEDGLSVDEKSLGFTISPHEECCVQQAVDILAEKEGSSTVITIGPEDAEEQLRDCLARGISEGVLLQDDSPSRDPLRTAEILSAKITELEQQGNPFDLILFGAESADLENGQVHLRVAHALNRPCLGKISALTVGDSGLVAKREGEEGIECYDVPFPAVLSLKDGINLPKHPSLRGTMAAKRKKVQILPVESGEDRRKLVGFNQVEQEEKHAQILGEGPGAAPQIVELLKKLEVLS